MLPILALLAFTTLAVATSAIIPPAPGCTTLLPIYPTPASNISTVYTSTLTTTSTFDCNGCDLVSRTFAYPGDATAGPQSNSTTLTTASTSTLYSCLAPSPTPNTTLSSIPPPAPSPTAVLLPQSPTAAFLLFFLRTLLFAAQLLTADGFPPDICGGLNPASLDAVGINGTVVQDTVCQAGSVQKYNPTLYALLVQSNGDGLKYVEAAIFAVTAIGVGGNVTAQERRDLCASVGQRTLEGGLDAFRPGGGGEVKRFVCGDVGQSGAGGGNGSFVHG